MIPTISRPDQELVSVRRYGAVGLAGIDATDAIQAAFEAHRQTGTPASSKPFYLPKVLVTVPEGIYEISEPLVLPAGVSLWLAPGAVLRATQAMDAVITTEEASYLDLHHGTSITGGGRIECADLAKVGILLRYFAMVWIRDLAIWDATTTGIELGSLTAPASSYEAFVSGVLIRRGLSTFAAGSSGIRFRNAGDCHVSDTIIMGVEKGIKGTVFDSKFDRVHVWNPFPISGSGNTDADVALSVGFETAGKQNIYSQCQVDGPLVSGGSGWYFTASGNVLLGCSVNGVEVPDGTCFGVYLDGGATATVMGCTFKGGGGSNRLAADVSGPGTSGSSLFGNVTEHVVAPAGSGAGVDPLYVYGDMRLEATVTPAGTTGAQTIDLNAGSVNFAAGATSVVVTNSRCLAVSMVIATVATNDATMKSVVAIPGGGSFTLRANAAATGETRVNWVLIND